MKVILLKDVKKLGRAHEVLEVSDGHALNFLIPGKLALAATPAALKEVEARSKEAESRRALDAKLLADNLSALAEARIVVKAKANDKGHLYDAVGEEEIMKAVKEQVNIDLPEDSIRIAKPFKEVGVYEIPVTASEAFGKFSITIEAE